MGSTTELRRALKASFFPHARERGFALDETRQPNSTVFRRRVGDRVQLFEVQWEKYGRPRFAVHFGSCPAEGLHVDGKVLAPEETFPTWCSDAGSLQPRPRTVTSSFRQDATFVQRLLGRPAVRDPVDVVEELFAWFPEVERYWASGEIGPHVRLWRLNK
jgi:hypothetical protein